MSALRWCLLVATLVLLACTPALWAADKLKDVDEVILRETGLATDDASLLAFLKRHTTLHERMKKLDALIRQLKSDEFADREEAAAQLVELGRDALPRLRVAAKSDDAEVTSRAKKCIATIENRDRRNVTLLIARRLAQRHPPGALEALLAYLPYEADPEAEEEIWFALDRLAVRAGKVPEALVKALKDAAPQRRALAACLLGRLGDAAQRRAVRGLLKDSDPWVRLRAAQGLLAGKDKAGLQVLAALLGEKTPVLLAWQAEELLHYVAGDEAPEVVVGSGRPEVRRKCREAWEAWWKARGAKVDLTREDPDHRRPGLMLVWYARDQWNKKKPGGVWLYGCRGKALWELKGANYPKDVRLLPEGRVLVGEDARVTERDLEGKVLWQYRLPPSKEERLTITVQGCRRLPDRRIVVLTKRIEQREEPVGCVREITPDGKEVLVRKFLLAGPHTDLRLLANGDVFCTDIPFFEGSERLGFRAVDPLTAKNRWVVVVNRKVLELHEATPLADGHILEANNEPHDRFRPGAKPGSELPSVLEEMDRSGRKVWQCTMLDRCRITQPLRLRNGNSLVLGGSLGVLEVDRAGRLVWELLLNHQADRQRVCLGLVRLGLDGPRPAGWTTDDVPVRIRQLRSQQLWVRNRAALRLAEHKPKALLPVVPALIEALDDNNIAYTCSRAIVQSGPKCLPYLLKALKDRRPRVRVWVLRCLYIGRDRPDWPVKAILEALHDPDPLVRRYAAGALGWAPRKHYDLVIPALIAALKDKEFDVVKGATAGLGLLAVHAPPAFAALMELFKSPERKYRALALEQFEFMGPSAKIAVPQLVKALRDKKYADEWPDIQWVLGYIGPGAAAAVPVLIEPFKDETYQGDRYKLMRILGSIGPGAHAAVPLLTQWVREGKGSQNMAAKTLGQIGPAAKDAVPVLVAALKVDPRKKLDIVDALVKDSFREEAIIALGRIGPGARAALPALREALTAKTWHGAWSGRGPSPDLKDKIQTALKRITGKP